MTKFNAKPAVTPKRVTAKAVVHATPAPKPAKAPSISRAKPNTTNAAGGAAYSMSLRSEIASTVLNSMLKGDFYKDASAELANLSAQGASMFPEKQVCLLSGFSEKIFDTMAQVERDPAALVHEIEAVNICEGIRRNG